MVSSSLKRKRHRIYAAPQDQHPQTSKNKLESSLSLASPSLLSSVLGGTLLRRLGLGLLGAVYACTVLTVLMVVAVVIGFGIVMIWAEEPVFVRERVYFDYAKDRPETVMRWRESEGVPVGHGFNVRLVLLLPESDFNREIGVFQVVADLISTNGNIVARTSQPCMLKFRSFPIRLTRTFLMSVPLLIGLTSETQKMIIPILKYNEEKHPRTESIKVTLISRPGTNFIPQIYESEIILNSKLPWKKDIVRRWKWTFCIWTSLYVYTILVAVLLCCFRWVIFLSVDEVERYEDREKEKEKEGEVVDGREIEESEVSEMLRKWRSRRRKRKAMFDKGYLDTMGS